MFSPWLAERFWFYNAKDTETQIDKHLPHVLAALPHDASYECLIDLVLVAVPSVDCNDEAVHDAARKVVDHTGQHLNTLMDHDSVAEADSV